MKSYSVWIYTSASAFKIVTIEARHSRDAKARAWRIYPRAYMIEVAR